MAEIVLYEDENHKNVLMEDYSEGEMIPANQHLIMHNGKGMFLDPGGHKMHSKLFADLSDHLLPNKIKYLFFSHKDPDIVAAINFWLMATEADGYMSSMWVRFVSHFGIDSMMSDRIKPISDEGCLLDLEGVHLSIIPAHFLHSCGNFQVYDPVSKILYSGDLGASIGTENRIIEDFDSHIQYIEGFHRRYMPTNKGYQYWANMVEQLDIEIIAPQHGAIYKGKENVKKFIDWVRDTQCGLDIMEDTYKLPTKLYGI